MGETLPLWSVAPFAGLLASIAILPLVARQFWHYHYPRVALAWSLLFLGPFVAIYRGEAVHLVLHALVRDYLPFVVLLGALFTICGGIVVRGALRATPRSNLLLLGLGTALASFIGTTGASMLLIRPLVRANAGRVYNMHVFVFFIFLVSNVGGALTPLGDPPLFLGFLLGVPFFWTMRLLPHTLLVTMMLLGLFYLLDRRATRKDALSSQPSLSSPQPVEIVGWQNAALLALVILTVLLSGSIELGTVHVLGLTLPVQSVLRDVILVGLALVSLRAGSARLRDENNFSWGPMREVAILFAAIFVTIVPALAILEAGERGALAPVVRSAVAPWQYFWLTGTVSSVLDNAPTYLTFLSTALGRYSPGVDVRAGVASLVALQPEILAGISAGAVFMGAMTYIGNAPNFMVRAIAEEAGVDMPSFFGFVVRWSVPYLLPVLILVSVVFFR